MAVHIHSELPLTIGQAAVILARPGLAPPLGVAEIKQYNHVYRIATAAGEALFLKTFTKDWYGTDVAATAGCVEHEVAAWAVLARHGIAVPAVVAAEYGCANPLGRPYLVTRALPGTPLTALLASASGSDFAALLVCAGRYLAACHALTFPNPGYLMRAGPVAPVAGGWQHFIWTAAQRQRTALNDLAESALPPALHARLVERFATLAADLAPDYATPRFTHGDCHAHQLFVERQGAAWRVSGMIDMEVASAGDATFDLIKLGLELSERLRPATRWWEPLFAGYGGAPNFERYQTRMLAVSDREFRGDGRARAGKTHAQLLAAVLEAEDWEGLFRALHVG